MVQPLLQLHDDMWREIMLFLDIHSLNSLIACSKIFSQLASEDCLWQKQVESKLNSLALIVSKPHFEVDNSWPSEFNFPSIYSKYFTVHVLKKENSYSGQVELLIKENFREMLVELFSKIKEKCSNEKIDYLEMIDRSRKESYHFKETTTLFMSKDDLLDKVNNADDLTVTNQLKLISQRMKFHCLMLGENGSGRTSMIFTVGYGEFPEYIPGVYENFELSYGGGENGDRKVCFELWDLMCHPDFDRLRTNAYSLGQLCCVCISVSSSLSIEMAITKFIPEIRLHCGNAIPIILIGCKIDERDEQFSPDSLKTLKKPLTLEEGEDIAKRTGCITYIETSSKKNIGLDCFLDILAASVIASHSFNNNQSSSFGKKKCQIQ